MNKQTLNGRAFLLKESKSGKTYTGIAPIDVDNVKNEISVDLSGYVTNSFASAFYFNKGTSTPEKVLNKTLFTKGAQMNGQSITGLARGVLPTDAPNYAQVNEVTNMVGINKTAISKNTLDLATVSASLITTNTAVEKNTGGLADINITLGAVIPLVTKNSQDVNSLKTDQGTQDVKIGTNERNIQQLIDQNKSQLNWTGNYDSSKTYMKNDVVTSTILAYISEIDNNKEPLTDSTAWFQFTPSVDVDLSKYYTKLETNSLLEPLEIRLTNIETFDEVVEGELAAVKQVLTLKTNNTDFNPVKQKVDILFPAQIEQIEKDIVVLQATKVEKPYVDDEISKVKSLISTNTSSITNNENAIETKAEKVYVDSEIDKVETSIATKQNTLIAGTNITIVGDTINSTGGSGGGGYPLALLLSPNQTANNNAATQQSFTLPEDVNHYSRFSVVIRDFTRDGLITINLVNDEKSFGQAADWFLYGESGPSTLKWVNVSGSGTTGVIWLYTNAAILFIHGEKATTPLRATTKRLDAREEK